MVTFNRTVEDTSKEAIPARMAEIIGRGRDRATNLLTRLATDTITDRIVEIGPKARTGRALEVAMVEDTGTVGINDGTRWRRFHPHAVGQLSERLGIPRRWVRESMDACLPWRRELIADVLATTIANQTKRTRLLVRSVGDDVRGVLSDSYRRLSSPVIAGAFATACQQVNAVPYEARIDDLRWSVSAMVNQPYTLNLGKHGEETIAAAVHINSSDFGMGALELAFSLFRLWCTNGVIGDNVLRQVHLGARLPNDLQFSQETYARDSETQALAMRDMVTQLLEPAMVNQKFAKLTEAAEDEVDAEKAIKGLVRANRISKIEGEEVDKALMNRDGRAIPTGPVTRYSLAQALSWIAQDAATNCRTEELEREAGTLLSV